MAPWKERIDKAALRQVGTTRVPLQKSKCNSRECNLGNFVSDAFVYYYAAQMPHGEDEWTSASIAMVQAGGIRTALDRGRKLISKMYS